MENNISFSEKLGRAVGNYFKKAKTSTHVYRACLIAILVIGIIATLIIYNWLSDVFTYYENSRPKHLAESYFNEIFNDDDYELLYAASGLDKNSPVSKEEFNQWFKNLIKDKTVRYAETSAGLSGNSKYFIYIDNQKIGDFLLVPSGIKNEGGFDILAKGQITLSLPMVGEYIIRVREGSVLTVNDVVLNKQFVTDSGNMISGKYTVYTVNCLVNKPTIKVTLNGEECYMVSPDGNDRVYTDEVLNDPVSDGGVVTTIRAIKGHSVYADGKLLGQELIIKNAGGIFEGYFKNGDFLEYVVYSYSGEISSVVIKDENGKERNTVKIQGGTIYTDAAIGASGTIEFLSLTDSTATLDGIDIDDKYLVEKDIPTDSCKYMYGSVKGITYQKYVINWVGDMPKLSIVNKYGNQASLSEVEGILTETIEYDSEALKKHGQLITDASHSYVKMMADDEAEWRTLMYFDPNSEIYGLVRDNPQGFFTAHDSYEFIDSQVKDLYVYDENTFSGTITFTFTVTRQGKVTEYPFNYTFYFRMVGQKYLIYNMINNG